MQENHLSELHIHEWAAVATILGFIVMLTISAYISAPPLDLKRGAPHQLSDNRIEVFVQGSVENPGPQLVKRGASLGEVLKGAKPLPEADLRRINLDGKVRSNQVVKIPAKKVPAPRKQQSKARKPAAEAMDMDRNGL